MSTPKISDNKASTLIVKLAAISLAEMGYKPAPAIFYEYIPFNSDTLVYKHVQRHVQTRSSERIAELLGPLSAEASAAATRSRYFADFPEAVVQQVELCELTPWPEPTDEALS